MSACWAILLPALHGQVVGECIAPRFSKCPVSEFLCAKADAADSPLGLTSTHTVYGEHLRRACLATQQSDLPAGRAWVATAAKNLPLVICSADPFARFPVDENHCAKSSLLPVRGSGDRDFH